MRWRARSCSGRSASRSRRSGPRADCCCSTSPSRWFRPAHRAQGGRGARAGDGRAAACHGRVPGGDPLLAGPGAISATILAAAKALNPLSLALFLGALVVVMAIALAAMLSAGRIDRALGATGRAVVERLLGLILSALAVQFVADGIKALIAA
ncbi:MarC family protein [Methyloraptor flagellatus]|uniref:UPF0056 membrane protein n=1 Tax=Methyloraptor flagellatus TaxID=3162530 RepID=A0AAU7XDA3_9HYPH